jgi:hypothetical protein
VPRDPHQNNADPHNNNEKPFINPLQTPHSGCFDHGNPHDLEKSYWKPQAKGKF